MVALFGSICGALVRSANISFFPIPSPIVSSHHPPDTKTKGHRANYFFFLSTLAEFKEIRKEWKARKKEEDNQRKAEEERQRASLGGAPPVDGSTSDPAHTPTSASYPPGVRPQLPPLGYNQAGGQVAGQYPGGAEQMYQSGNGGQIYSNYPASPYQQGQQVYQQRMSTSFPLTSSG